MLGFDVYELPPSVTSIDLIGPRTEAVPCAPVPPPPTIVIEGCEVYPVPPVLIRIRETSPLVIIAVAAAPDPLPPTIETNGEVV